MPRTDTAVNISRQLFSAVAAPATAQQLPVAALAAATAVVTWRQEGSIAAPDWLPLAILAALLLTMVAASGAGARPPALVLFGGAALLLLAAWNAVSTAWSPSPAGARDEALLTALYLLTLLVPVLSLGGASARHHAVRLVVATLGILGGLTAFKLALAARPSTLLFGGRLDFPVSYVNACSALFVIGFWPAVVVTARRESQIVTRAVAAGAGSLFLALAVAAQSKGTIFGLAISALLLFGLAPGRLRLLAATVLVTAAPAAAIVPLTAPYRSTAVSVAHRAGWTALAAAAISVVIGVAYAVADRRLEIDADRRRLIGRAVLALVVAGVASAMIVFFATVPAPGTWASRTWASFKHRHPAQAGSTHLTSLGSNRYDFWRVALDEAATHPLRGVGGRGFYSAYLEHRRSQETPLRAHSLYLDALSELGVPGLLLLLVGVGAPLALVARRLSQPHALAAFGATTYFLAHAAVDWIWTVPVVGIPLFLFLGIGCAGEGTGRLPRSAAITTAIACSAAAIFAFTPPWLAHRYVLAAYSTPAPAADLSYARRLDPLSLEPYWAAWRLAATGTERVQALRAALRVEPQSVAVLFQLGLAYRSVGRRAESLVYLRRARALDPLEPAIRKALLTASR